MKLTLNLNTTAKYITFWNSIFKLTNKEMSVLLDFVDIVACEDSRNTKRLFNKYNIKLCLLGLICKI